MRRRVDSKRPRGTGFQPLLATHYARVANPCHGRAFILFVLVGVLLSMTMSCREDRPRAQALAEIGEKTRLARAQQQEHQPIKVNSEKLQLAAAFWGAMPTGVAVSKGGRIFVNFPRWGDPVEFTVAEVKSGQVVAYPDAQINKLDERNAANTLVSVQSVVIDDHDRLWLLDTGSINFQPVIRNGPKLLCVDLKTDKVIRKIDFREGDALKPTTYLNDVRFDLNRGQGGIAFITDSSDSGPNGIIVVDLDTGEAWRRLNDHPSTKAQENFVPMVEGQPLMARPTDGPEAYLKIGADGIAISADKKTLYYCPLASRHLYSVSVDALADRNVSDEDVAATVKDLGDRGYASDGLDTGPNGRIYLTDYEHNAIRVRDPDGQNERILVADPRIIWPDSISATGNDGFIYFTANQLNRQKQFHKGKDLRVQPYSLFRIPMDGATRTETAARAKEAL